MSTTPITVPSARPFAFRKPTYGAASRTERRRDEEMVGSGVAMRRLRTQLQRIGPYYRSVLLRGETGSGKETAARVLHASSPCADGPFVSCNAAVATDALIERQGGTRLTAICGGRYGLSAECGAGRDAVPGGDLRDDAGGAGGAVAGAAAGGVGSAGRRQRQDGDADYRFDEPRSARADGGGTVSAGAL